MSPAAALARDFMVKTRRRKGMSEDVTQSTGPCQPVILWNLRLNIFVIFWEAWNRASMPACSRYI